MKKAFYLSGRRLIKGSQSGNLGFALTVKIGPPAQPFIENPVWATKTTAKSYLSEISLEL
jgi:hypothetical protein